MAKDICVLETKWPKCLLSSKLNSAILCVSGSIIENTWSASLMAIVLTPPPFTLSMSWLWPAGDTIWTSDLGTEKTRERTLPDCLRWADTVLSSVNKHDFFVVQLSNSFFAFHICRNSWMTCLWVTRSLARSEIFSFRDHLTCTDYFNCSSALWYELRGRQNVKQCFPVLNVM